MSDTRSRFIRINRRKDEELDMLFRRYHVLKWYVEDEWVFVEYVE